MPEESKTCPASRDNVIDLYFMEHRAKLLDVAAFLDRLDRAKSKKSDVEDFRIAAFRKAITLLQDETSDRTRRILELFSDPTHEPIARAPGKGAAGAWPGPPA